MENMTRGAPPAVADLAHHRSERLCAAIDLCFGWQGAEAECTRAEGYTGRVILTAPAVMQVIRDRAMVAILEQRVTHLSRELAGAAVYSSQALPRVHL